MKRELAKADGHVDHTPGMEWGILPTGDMAESQFMLYRDAMMELDQQGPNSTMTGKDTRKLSGRAIGKKTESGQVEVAVVYDSLRAWQERVYRKIWNRIKQYWTEEKWIRVTDDEKKVKFVGLNRKKTLLDVMEEEAALNGQPWNKEMREVIRMKDPRLEQIVVGVMNNVAELDIDIEIDEVPDVASMQQEEFELLITLAQSRKDIPTDLIIQSSSLRNKEKIIKRIKGEDDPAVMAEIEKKKAEMEALAKEQMKAQIEETLAKAEKYRSEAVSKRVADAEKIAGVIAGSTPGNGRFAGSGVQG